ncbi:MAG: hypothetical protein QOH72_4885 [Solirubrobacteraceae bacterium]|nr:hypothetical protein [Solirubrobacteraceae bacterium]
MARGATEALIVLARVRAGEADAARAAIAQHWEQARRSPFADVPGTHLARLQVLKPPARRGRRGARECVLLSADVDAPLGPWVERFRAAAAGPLDAVLGHCAFYPGAAGPAAFARWVAANRVPVGFSVIGSPDATLAEVGAALDLQRRLGAFAEETQRMGPAALHTAWRERQGGRA